MKVLFVDIDTLRPDHMGCYGYYRNTTPRMDSVAEEGTHFERYYCSDAPCLPSRASLISGMFGIKHGAVGHGGTAGDRRLYGRDRDFRDPIDSGNFNNIFRKAGMYTASVSTFPERHSSFWFTAGFNEVFNEGEGGGESGEKVIPYVLNWLDNNATSRKDWFLHVHLWDPHTPYRAPAEFGNPFEDDDMSGCWIDEETFARHQKAVGPHTLNELNMYDDHESDMYPRNPGRADDMAGLKRIMDGYDCGVAYTDLLVGQIIDKLKELSIYDDTAIIITSDHGENFGELGIYAEHGTADHACCNIPLIVKWPGIKKGHVDRDLHYSLDLLPTLCDLLSVEKSHHWDGVSFAPALTEGASCGRESLVISQMAHVCQRSAVFGDWLYMRTYHDGYHLFDREMLYNLKEDIHEQKDVKDKHPEICAKGAKIILDWQDDAMSTSRYTEDPMWTVLAEGGPFHARGHFEEYHDRLVKTGRQEAADLLARKEEAYKPVTERNEK
ncbi:MAG: sulfatase-like hydrolase/transferase [Butyrivibrio sp.]|nr:sulfatase-like hydrolase/transferase [Butyrivibrio sp.]